MKKVIRNVVVTEMYYVSDDCEAPITEVREGRGTLISAEVTDENFEDHSES